MAIGQAQSTVGTFFAPAPRSFDAANERVWGASRLVVATPAPIATREFQTAILAETTGVDTKSLLLLTARLSRVHSLKYNQDYRLSPSPEDRLLKSVEPLRVRLPASCTEVLFENSRDAGIRNPVLRSDQCWVGGGSPLDSALALPDTSRLEEHLKDYFTFLEANQANPSYEVVEAAAYQLLMIHPLADGNGRVARAILMKLAARTGSPYALYFVWRLMFDKRRTVGIWADASATGRATQDSSHYDAWLRSAIAITDARNTSVNSGLDARIANALLAYGYVDEKTILHANSACSVSLARKLAERAIGQQHAALVQDLTTRLTTNSIEMMNVVAT